MGWGEFSYVSNVTGVEEKSNRWVQWKRSHDPSYLNNPSQDSLYMGSLILQASLHLIYSCTTVIHTNIHLLHHLLTRGSSQLSACQPPPLLPPSCWCLWKTMRFQRSQQPMALYPSQHQMSLHQQFHQGQNLTFHYNIPSLKDKGSKVQTHELIPCLSSSVQFSS